MNEDFSIRTMHKEDLVAAMHLKNEEGWNQTKEDWLLFLNQAPELCLVACQGQQVVGTVTSVPYGHDLAWIGMMLVDKAYRGKGISKLLLNTIIQKSSYCKTIKLDATPAGLPVYQKLGFRVEQKLYRMVRVRVSSTLQNEPDTNAIPVTEQELPKILALDYIFFGADRSTLIHRIWSNTPPSKSWMVKEGGNILGYVFGRPGTRYHQIGPLFATSTVVAKQLITAYLKNRQDVPIVIDTLEDKQNWLNYLERLGFKIQRELYRMYLDKNRIMDRKEFQYLIAGPELG